MDLLIGWDQVPAAEVVNTTNTQRFLPEQATPVVNLVLAGAHPRTFADVWSIEAAVESGRRAARVIEPDVAVIPEHVPWMLRRMQALDDACYALGLPQSWTCSGSLYRAFSPWPSSAAWPSGDVECRSPRPGDPQ